MRRIVMHLSVSVMLILVLSGISSGCFAQDAAGSIPFKKYLYVQPNIGASQYFGDLNYDNIYNKHPKIGFGGVLGFQLNPLLGFRAQVLKTTLYSERDDKDRKFSSDMLDGSMQATININELTGWYKEKRLINLYLFGGVGYNSFQSKLEVLSTGSLVDEHTEKQNEIFVPLGAGISFRLNCNSSINIEYGDHGTFKNRALDFTSGVKSYDHYSYASVGLKIKLSSKDYDKDGVKDKNDLCPEISGKASLAGCPDRDNDGIADNNDDCPDAAGKPAFKGCPDSDGDGIIDTQDACPDVAGKKEFNGCPDTDNDGIPDIEDKCPDVYGVAEFMGCPDRDGDKVIDSEDLCPDVKGLAEFGGCPDTDGDGIPDNLDKCPDVPGVASNNGCPEVLASAYFEKTVNFDTDASVVFEKNIVDLDEVVAFVKENPGALISVAGFADSRESVEYNLRLSESRVDNVIKYLVDMGVKPENIEKAFFGKSNPIADNNTKEGRALNRRVEIKITK